MSHEVRKRERRATLSDARPNARSGCCARRHQEHGWRRGGEVKA
jgi:hypothetical protein